MKLASLIFFGEEHELSSIILKKLNIIEFRPSNPEFKGLYLVENKFGLQDLRKIDMDYSSAALGDWLVYKYLTPSEAAELELNSANKRIYVLLHGYYSVDHLMLDQAILNKLDQLNYIVDSANDEFKTAEYAEKKFKTKNIFQLQKNKKKKGNQSSHQKNNVFVSALAPFLKLLLNPSQELAQLVTLFRYSKQRYFSRVLELALFVHFFIVVILVVPFWNMITGQYYFFNRMLGVFKVVSIKLGYAIRHMALMAGFKSFGVVVDSANSAERMKDRFLKLVYYDYLLRIYYDKIRNTFVKIWFFVTHVYFKYLHAFYHQFIWKYLSLIYYKFFRAIWTFIAYKIVQALYYKVVVNFFYYRILHSFYHNVYLKVIVGGVVYKVIQPFYYKVIVQFIYYKIINDIIIYKVIQPLYYNVIQQLYYKVVIQFLYYQVLHSLYHKIILKIFGFLFYKIVQPFYYKVILDFLYYKIIHNFYHNLILKLINLLIYRFFLKLYYKIGYGYLLPAYYGFLNIIRYKLRHWFLMFYYKSYGFLYDLCTFTYRFFKLYLMYPFFKIYWFFNFQFNKRIRKTIK